MLRSGFRPRTTRYLVLDDDGEQPIGFVHAKDVLQAIEVTADEAGSSTAADLARNVLVVPETRRIDGILAEFQTRGGPMSVVIDGWGVFEEILTIEAILEEIVGDICDEFDRTAQVLSIEKRDDGSYVVAGGLSFEAVNERLDGSVKSDDVETIGGFVFSHLGRVPEIGDEIERNGDVLRVDAVEDARAARVVIQPRQPSRETGEA